MSNGRSTRRAGSKPITIQMAELAVAAGFTGENLTLCFDGFPATVLCSYWRRLADGLDAKRVLHVHALTDVRTLEKGMDKLQLVIVHTPRLFNQIQWLLQVEAGTECASRPSVFSYHVPDDLDSDPGATLVLHAERVEAAAITQWLLVDPRATPEWSEVLEMSTGECSSQLLEVGERMFAHAGLRFPSLRDREIVRRFTAGACLLRMHTVSNPTACLQDSVLAAYDLVKNLLQSSIVCPVTGPAEQLSLAMVSRANVYLDLKYGEESAGNPFIGEFEEYSPSSSRRRTQHELITRRELADLGNVNSSTVRNLVEYLKRSPDGYQRFQEMGLSRPAPDQQRWEQQPVDTLLGFLEGWTPKQLRTRFDRLRRDGLITAERECANGRLLFRLPESLASPSRRFAYLPSADELAAGGAAGALYV